MRIEQLQYFLEIALSKSISLAAENLYVTQPALSRAIKLLEDELGVYLFTRTVEGTFLTEHGQMLYTEIQDILDKAEALKKHAQSLSSRPSLPMEQHLEILTFSTLTDTIFPAALTAVNEQFPHISMTVRNLKLTSFSEPIDLSPYDLIVLVDINNMLYSVLSHADFYREELFTEKYFAVVCQDHPLAINDTIALEDAFHYDVIALQNGLPIHDLYSALSPKAKNIRIFMQSNNAHIVTKTLEQQQTVLLATQTLVQQNYLSNPRLKTIPIRDIWGQGFALYDPEHPYLDLLRQLLTHLKIPMLNQSF